MLRLNTQLKIGSQSYDVLILGRGEWDFRTRSIKCHIVPAQEKEDHVRVAKEKDKDAEGGYKILAPPPVVTVEIQDRGDDPAIARALQAFQAALELIEQLLVNDIGERTYELGEDEQPLAATFESNTKEYKNEKPQSLPNNKDTNHLLPDPTR